MIAKLFRGTSFSRCLRYLLDRDEACLLDSAGIRNYRVEAMIDDLNAQRRLRPDVLRPVGHTVLSWSPEDRGKFRRADMAAYAKEYMTKMEVINTQFLTVLHTDTEHRHLHLVYNRVDNDAKTIDLNKEWYRSRLICEEMTERYGFHRGTAKIKVKREALNGKDRTRYRIHDSLEMALREATSWPQMESMLALCDIKILYKRDRESEEIQGVVFDQGNVKFKGSAIGRKFNYQTIAEQLEANKVLAVSADAQDLKLELSKLHQKISTTQELQEGYRYQRWGAEQDIPMDDWGVQQPRGLWTEEEDLDQSLAQKPLVKRGRRI